LDPEHAVNVHDIDPDFAAKSQHAIDIESGLEDQKIKLDLDGATQVQ
jgi:hypothetical protein